MAEPPRQEIDVRSSGNRRSANGEQRRFDVHVPPHLPYFRGHFDGDPILPAVVQLQIVAIGQIEAAWPDLEGLREITKLKFVRPVRPDDRLALVIERATGSGSVRFAISRDGDPCSSGTLTFARYGR